MHPVPHLLAVATAVPPYVLDQQAVVERASRLFAGAAGLERLLPVFASSGIRKRYSAVPIDWFAERHDWAERNRLYLSTALDLLESAAGRGLDQAGLAASQLGAIVVVSTTGIATPSLDALLIERMRLPPNVQRLPIFGLDCAGGVIGLSRAATIASAMPDKAVLLLVVELCSLTFRGGDRSKSNIVASALFGDGAAAVLLNCGGDGPAIVAGGEHTWPGTIDVMGWDVAEDGLKPVFSRDIPRLVAMKMGEAASEFLNNHGLGLADIDHFVCHPGGPKVIAALEAAFSLSNAKLGDAREVLQEFGNMSAASILFVLERALARPWRTALLSALGPGFTAGFALLRRQ